MRKYLFSFILLFGGIITGRSQSETTFGAGYFGETISHPGLIAQIEYDTSANTIISVPLRAAIGYYFHRRNHQAIFVDLATGLRWRFSPRWYTGLNVGVGLMSSWHHSNDGVFVVDNAGNVSETNSFAGIDFMPITALELGYKIKKSPKSNYVWLRPKAFWQMNVNERALFHFAIALGYSFTIN